LDEGRIVEDGNHHDLISQQGIYCEMYQVQAAQYNL
jgi:ABC-type multidrug transport system fused ATPase/permease subunit